MITSKDLDTLMDVFPTRPEVEAIVESTVERVFDEKFDQKFDEKLAPFRKEVMEGIDKIISMIEAQNLPNAARDTQLSRHDQWIHKIADKTQVELKG